MAHPYANHQIAKELLSIPRGTLEFMEVDRRLNEFLQRYADIPYYAEDPVGIGRRFPYLGDCLGTLQWSQEILYVAYTGDHNLIVTSEQAWPEYPCRRLTQDEFYDVMRPLTEAYYASLKLELGQTRRQEIIDVQFERLFGYIQQLRIAG